MFKLACSCLLALGFSLAYASDGFPCLKLTNRTGSVLNVRHDADWDDQILVVNGRKQHSLNANLADGQKIKICGLWYQFGIDFYSNNKFAYAIIDNQESELASLHKDSLMGIFNCKILEQTHELLKLDLYLNTSGNGF